MGEPYGPALELRLERGRAVVRLAGGEVAPGVEVDEVVLAVPTGGGLDVAGGPARFRSVLCDLDRLELRAAAGPIAAALARARLAGADPGAPLRVALRPGFVELAGALEGGAPFTAKL